MPYLKKHLILQRQSLVHSLSLKGSLSSQSRRAFKIPDWFLLYPSQLLSSLKEGRPATVFLQLSNTGMVPSLSLSASLSSQGRETSNSLPTAYKIPDWFLLYPYQLLSTSREGKPLPLKREIPPFHSATGLYRTQSTNDFKIY